MFALNYVSGWIGTLYCDQGRKRLRVAMSCNGGETWANVAEIEQGHYKYYFHYPTLAQVSLLQSI